MPLASPTACSPRAERFHEREEQLHHLVTDYHHAGQVRRIHTDAQERAAKVTADAERRIAALHERAGMEAAIFEDAANAAVRSVLQFGESRGAVVSPTGLSAAQVRAIEYTERPVATARQPAHHDDPPAQTTP